MASIDVKGRTALVTGASSGLGVDFARELARRGSDVVLVARRRDRLEAVAETIRGEFGVTATPVTMDLGAAEAPAQLHEKLRSEGVTVDLLVNNAGFGLFGNELDLPWERENAMLQLDIVNLVHLSKLFARDMVSRGFGAILQVASTGAYQPSPGYASYSAAKSFVLSYGYALDYELRGTGVSCTVISPGVTATEFLQVSGQKKNWFHKATMMSSEKVARIGIDALLARRGSVITGWVNKLACQSNRFNPRSLSTAIAAMAMKS